MRSRLDRCRWSCRRRPRDRPRGEGGEPGHVGGRAPAPAPRPPGRAGRRRRAGLPCRSVISPRAAGTRVQRIIWRQRGVARSCGPCGALQLPGEADHADQGAGDRDARWCAPAGGARRPGPRRLQSRWRLPVGAQGQHQAERGDVDGGRRTAVAEQREGHPRGRDQAEVARDRDRDLDADQRGEAGRGQRRGTAPGAAAGADDPPDEHGRGEDGQGAGEDPVLLDEAGEGEVGLPLGQVQRHQPVQRVLRAAGQAAPGQRDVHLQDRPAGTVGVGRAAEEGVQPLLLVGVQQVLAERQHDARPTTRKGTSALSGIRPSTSMVAVTAHRTAAVDRSGSVSTRAIGRAATARAARQAPRPRPVAAEHLGQHQEQAELGELGGLHGEGAEGDPPAGAADGQAAHVDRHQEQHAQRRSNPTPASAGRRSASAAGPRTAPRRRRRRRAGAGSPTGRRAPRGWPARGRPGRPPRRRRGDRAGPRPGAAPAGRAAGADRRPPSRPRSTLSMARLAAQRRSGDRHRSVTGPGPVRSSGRRARASGPAGRGPTSWRRPWSSRAGRSPWSAGTR